MALKMRGLGVRLGFCLAVVLLAGVSGIQAEDKKEEEFVLTLDHSNFSDTVSKHDIIVVEFYAPWCGHCQKLAPEYEKAASVLSKHDPPIPLAKIDAADEANKELAMKYEIQGLPTIKILRNGGKVVQDYNGPREADGIVQYVKKQLGPASVEIKSADDAANVIDDKKIFIAGVFPKFEGEEYENFIKLAEKLRSDYDFGHTLDAKLLPKGDSSVSGPVIRLFKPFDELFVDFKDFDLDAAQKFIEREDMPSIVVFDPEDESGLAYLGKIFSGENTKVTMLLDFGSENAAALKSKFYDIAYLLKGGDLRFVIGDLEPSKPLIQYFNLDASQAPLIFIQKSGDKKYLKANVEPDQVVPWFKKFLDDKLELYTMSQPIPQENNEPVKVVVLDSLQDMVFKSGKEVFLEFYAPWCGHCQKVAPILEEVAVSYEKDPNVMIAKFDATANDVPSDIFSVQGYPTMFFISSKGKIVEYQGGRSKEDIINFIEQNRSDKQDKSESNQPEEKSESVVEEKGVEEAALKDEL